MESIAVVAIEHVSTIECVVRMLRNFHFIQYVELYSRVQLSSHSTSFQFCATITTFFPN